MSAFYLVSVGSRFIVNVRALMMIMTSLLIFKDLGELPNVDNVVFPRRDESFSSN